MHHQAVVDEVVGVNGKRIRYCADSCHASARKAVRCAFLRADIARLPFWADSEREREGERDVFDEGLQACLDTGFRFQIHE